MNVFDPRRQFDRIVSVEMFEHMTNWRELLTRVRVVAEAGRPLLLHVFTHRTGAYLFDRADGEDWIAQHFFTGGMMPSHHLIRQYADLFAVEKEWRWSGTHYQRTARGLAGEFRRHRDEIEARAARRSMATTPRCGCGAGAGSSSRPSGLFGYADGSEWGVSHYRLKAAG